MRVVTIIISVILTTILMMSGCRMNLSAEKLEFSVDVDEAGYLEVGKEELNSDANIPR